MGKDILHRVGNGGHCGYETVSREVLPQVEIPVKWTQEPPCFAITIGVRLRSHTNKQSWKLTKLLAWYTCTAQFGTSTARVKRQDYTCQMLFSP